MAVASHAAAFVLAGAPLPKNSNAAFLALPVSPGERIFGLFGEIGDFYAKEAEPCTG
jgi:hypothetical protein